jgi:HSP20 family protein
MHMRDLMPWHRDREGAVPAETDRDHPFVALQRDMNKVFESFWQRVDKPFGMLAAEPKLDMTETEGQVRVAIDLPGLDPKDVELTCTDSMLFVKGEKREEKESGEGARHIVERSYGRFERTVPLPRGLDTAKAEARFDKGVLTLTIPRSPEAPPSVRKIEVKAS